MYRNNLLESELMEHEKILKFFKKLPVDLRKHVQTFHVSKRPVMACHTCNKRFYQITCFHEWIPWCRYHNAFPLPEEPVSD